MTGHWRSEKNSTGRAAAGPQRSATVLINRGATYDDLTEYEKAIRDYDRALKIMEELDREGRLPDRNGLAGVLINRGNTHRSLTEYQKAVGDHDRALKIMEDLDREGRLPDRNYLRPSVEMLTMMMAGREHENIVLCSAK